MASGSSLPASGSVPKAYANPEARSPLDAYPGATSTPKLPPRRIAMTIFDPARGRMMIPEPLTATCYA